MSSPTVVRGMTFRTHHLRTAEPYRHPQSQIVGITADITPALDQPQQQLIIGDQPDNGEQRQQKLALRVMKVGRYTNRLAFTWVDANGAAHHYFGPQPLEPGRQIVGAMMNYRTGECLIHQSGEFCPAHDPTPLAPINKFSNPLYVGSNGNRSFVFMGEIHCVTVWDAARREDSLAAGPMYRFDAAAPDNDYETRTPWVRVSA